MSHIKICVSRPSRSKTGDFNAIYTNVIEINDCLNFDYSVVVNALNVLYPYKDKIVSLTLY